MGDSVKLTEREDTVLRALALFENGKPPSIRQISHLAGHRLSEWARVPIYRCLKAGLVAGDHHLPQRWSLTDAGRAALTKDRPDAR